jgi:hypothetical protein
VEEVNEDGETVEPEPPGPVSINATCDAIPSGGPDVGPDDILGRDLDGELYTMPAKPEDGESLLLDIAAPHNLQSAFEAAEDIARPVKRSRIGSPMSPSGENAEPLQWALPPATPARAVSVCALHITKYSATNVGVDPTGLTGPGVVRWVASANRLYKSTAQLRREQLQLSAFNRRCVGFCSHVWT